MLLPKNVRACVDALERAGFAAYLVGGCVRDACLGLQPQDFDLCTAALPEETQAVCAAQKLVLAGKKHGTVGVVTDSGVVEITTFRAEGDYADNRHPGWVKFVPSVEEDLARRDFTVNAMAYSPTRGVADPFGGRADLENRVLRAVGDPDTRFREDSLRILRGVRFAVKYRLTVEPNTMDAMTRLAPLMDSLARERVFEELCKLLPLVTAADLIRFAPVITRVIPELAPTVGFDQRSTHHAYDIYTHIAHVVEAVPAQPALRWAALLHDVGKPACFTVGEDGHGHFKGHAGAGTALADAVLQRLKAPTRLREEVLFLIGQHMTKLEPDKRLLRRWLSRWGAQWLEALLALQEADMSSKGTGKAEDMAQFDTLREMLARIIEEEGCLSIRDLAVDGHDLMELGLEGAEIGRMLRYLLEQVLEETLSNEKCALLQAAKDRRKYV
ncbi:MAG: HD domain-containing protein [Firmicutes bacterium]|nr:HD domain-containing protein [Bacillota bacterium]